MPGFIRAALRRGLGIASSLAPTAALLLGVPGASASPEQCLRVSGRTALRCLHRYTAEVEACRSRQDAACETAARAPGGALEAILAAGEAPIRQACDDVDAETLGHFGLEDLVTRIPEACADFAEDLLEVSYSDALGALPPDTLVCQRRVGRNLRRAFARGARAAGTLCSALDFTGELCDRARRDALVTQILDRVERRLLGRCGAELDALNLSATGATTAERLGEVLDIAATRSRHFALQVYPPNDLGPSAERGPFPVGVTTLALADPTRESVDPNAPMGTPRPVTVEVYYPSTPEAVSGVPRDVLQILGIDVLELPAFRDVARAPGTGPLVVFSHGNGGIRTQSFFFNAHLASHGFVVASPDHHGNTFVDAFAGIVDPLAAANRPLDMSFVIDELLALNATMGHLLESSIDPARIGASGHSFGGFTVFTLAGGTTPLGTFTDARVRAIFPQAPGGADFLGNSFFSSIPIPTLIVGGSLDETTPFASEQAAPFANLPSGASVVGLAEIPNAGHFTFSDFCDIPRDLSGFLGGFDEACEPRHLPFRHAHDIVRYLGLNFFEGVLNADAAALARITPAGAASIEDLVLQLK